jgi:hypothetical protein
MTLDIYRWGRKMEQKGVGSEWSLSEDVKVSVANNDT